MKKSTIFMYRFLYHFAKTAKYIAICGLILTFFSDLYVFKLLCLFILIDVAFGISAYKCSFLQLFGILNFNYKYKKSAPSVDNYKCQVEYDLPFRAKWVAVNGCFRKDYSHSWYMGTQRYAYDFIILDEKGKSYDGEFNQVESYYCYDMDILTPADGIVVELINSAQESLIFPKGGLFSRAKHIAGNYVVIKHSEQEFSLLAHLKKDSMKVAEGDIVYRGQLIAKCGNTGNSSEPHLHYQLQNGQSFYSSAGLPVQFKNIKLSQVDMYEQYDPRPHMSMEHVSNGYVTRGFTVENIL